MQLAGLDLNSRFLGHCGFFNRSESSFSDVYIIAYESNKTKKRVAMIFGSRFTRDFLWYHILSGKIITFSLPVTDIYILKAASRCSFHSLHNGCEINSCGQVKAADVKGKKKMRHLCEL